MDILDERLEHLLTLIGMSPQRRSALLRDIGAIKIAKQEIIALLRAAGTPLLPSVMADPHSPRVEDEVGEHNRIYCYIPGNFDIGHIEIKGFTLVSNNELAALKQLALGRAPT